MSNALDVIVNEIYAVEGRLTEIRDAFKSATVDPTKNAEFLKFIEDHYSEIAMRYVLTGAKRPVKLEDLTLDQREQLMTEMGIVTSKGSTSAGALAPDIDPALLALPSARAAIAAGLDLTADPDD